MNGQSDEHLPAVVRRAIAAGRAIGFESSCLPETGLLLRALAATVGAGAVAEFGTGCGYGAAWIASGLSPGARLITVESNRDRAGLARDVLSDFPNAEVVHAGWQEILQRGPFQLAFVDASPAKLDGAALVIEALAPGGIALIDDLTPLELWPEEWRGKPDPVRERWLHDARLISTELRVTAGHAVILAARVRT
jgi:predicted O-methyltransferase YrrM